MKGDKKQQLHTKTKEELKNIAKEIRREIAEMTVKIATNKEKNVHIIHQRKKDLARVLTALKEKEKAHG